jgi:hypothetical protein
MIARFLAVWLPRQREKKIWIFAKPAPIEPQRDCVQRPAHWPLPE